MSSPINNVDSKFFQFIYHEDIYLIPGKGEFLNIPAKDVAVKPIQESEVKEEVKTTVKVPVKETPINTPQKTPSIPKTSIPPTTTVAKVAVVAATQSEIFENEEFLSKILQAVGLSMKDASTITNANPSEPILASNYLIFGVDNQKLTDFTDPVYLNQVLIKGKSKYIFTYSLAELAKSTDKKKALWNAMKEAFK